MKKQDMQAESGGGTVALGYRESDNAPFSMLDGELLSWTLDLTHADEEAGCPRMRAVIRAMMVHRPAQLDRERREMLKASFDRMFGHNAAKVLRVIEEELASTPPSAVAEVL